MPTITSRGRAGALLATLVLVPAVGLAVPATAAPRVPRIPTAQLPVPFDVTIDVDATRTTTWHTVSGKPGDVCGTYADDSGREVVVVGVTSGDGTANLVSSRLSRPYLNVLAKGDKANVNVNRTRKLLVTPCRQPPGPPDPNANDCGRKTARVPVVRVTWTIDTAGDTVALVPDKLIVAGQPLRPYRACPMPGGGLAVTTFEMRFPRAKVPAAPGTTRASVDRTFPCEGYAASECEVHEVIRVEVTRDRRDR